MADKKPFWKNPWFLGAIYGMAFLTLIRPFMRSVPEPPPVLAQLSTLSLLQADSTPINEEHFRSHVTVLGFFSQDCDADCDARFAVLMDLQRELDFALGDDGGIRISLVDHRPAKSPAALHEFARARDLPVERWDWLTGTQPNVDQLIDTLEPIGPPPLDDQNEGARKKTPLLNALFLIDRNGGIRGRYAGDSKGLAEVFHRSRHVLFDENR